MEWNQNPHTVRRRHQLQKWVKRMERKGKESEDVISVDKFKFDAEKYGKIMQQAYEDNRKATAAASKKTANTESK